MFSGKLFACKMLRRVFHQRAELPPASMPPNHFFICDVAPKLIKNVLIYKWNYAQRKRHCLKESFDINKPRQCRGRRKGKRTFGVNLRQKKSGVKGSEIDVTSFFIPHSPSPQHTHQNTQQSIQATPIIYISSFQSS